jgi:hypothetical protein
MLDLGANTLSKMRTRSRLLIRLRFLTHGFVTLTVIAHFLCTIARKVDAYPYTLNSLA